MNWRSVRLLFFFFSPGFFLSSELLDTSSPHINPSSPIVLHVLCSLFLRLFFFSLFYFFLPAPPFFATIFHYSCFSLASKP